jgi:hypothetical protein
MLKDPLTLIIPGSAIKGMNDSDVQRLLDTYALAEQAKDAFLKREITFDEYIQLLETAQMNVDDYMEAVESNLETLRLL